MRQTFTAEQTLPFPVEVVFAFFANPQNLPRLMPSWQKARIEEAAMRPPPPMPAGEQRLPGIVAGNGTRLLLSFRAAPWLPLRLGWEARIEDFAWNEGFCDLQLRGPFAYWRHCHRVQAAGGGCVVRDHVEFTLRGDPLTRPMLPVVRKQMAELFRVRQERTAEWMPKFAAMLGVDRGLQ